VLGFVATAGQDIREAIRETQKQNTKPRARLNLYFLEDDDAFLKQKSEYIEAHTPELRIYTRR
jgi:hypothetical protein